MRNCGSPLSLSTPVANLVLQDTVERIYAGKLYADVPRGIFLVRGENVLLLGEVVCAVALIWYIVRWWLTQHSSSLLGP